MGLTASVTKPSVLSNTQKDLGLARLEVGDLVLDHAKRMVKRNGKTLPMSDMRYTMLYMLACHALANVEQPLLKKVIMHQLYGEDWPKSNSFDVLMHKLRASLSDAESVVSIRSFYGCGFKLVIRARLPAVQE